MRLIILGFAAITLASGAAQAQTYSFSVPQKLVNIVFESRMEIEDILGTSNSVSGSVKLDGKGGGVFSLEVPVASLNTGIAMRDEHLRSAKWLNASAFPKITYAGKKIRSAGKGSYQVTGELSLAGKKRPLKVTLKARKIPRAKAKQLGLGDQDWLRVRGSFNLKLSQFGVKIPSMAAAKVNDHWTVKVSLFAKRVK